MSTSAGITTCALSTQNTGKLHEQTIAGSPRFEARPSACYDAKGRLWIAYEEGPEKWGKDFGALQAAATRSTTRGPSVWSAWRTAS